MVMFVLSGCVGSKQQAGEVRNYALVSVVVEPYISQKKDDNVAGCNLPSKPKLHMKFLETAPIAGELGKWFIHGLKSGIQLSLIEGKRVTSQKVYSDYVPAGNTGKITVGDYHGYDKKDYPHLPTLARALNVDRVLLISLYPEFRHYGKTGKRITIRPDIRIRVQAIDKNGKYNKHSEYRYKSDRLIHDNSMARACIKARRSFEYYDSQLAGIDIARRISVNPI